MSRRSVHMILFGGALIAAGTTPASAQRARTTATLVLGAPRLTLGSEDVEGPTLFGHVQGVTIDGDGRIYVLDVSDNTIRIFEGRGQFIGRAGRSGRGPGDFANPWGLVHDGRRGLFVADQVTGITHFETSGTGAEFVRVLGRSLLPRTVCVVGDSLITGGVSDARLMHVLDRDGDPYRGFGDSFSADTIPALREMADRQPVVAACNSPRRRLVVAQHRGPLVRGYDLEGRQLWQFSVPEYRGTEYALDSRNGRPTIFSGLDYTQSLVYLAPDVVLLQVAKMTREPANPRTGTRARLVLDHVDSYLMDADRGTVLHRGKDLPSILTARNGIAIESRTDPFPQLIVRPYSLRR